MFASINLQEYLAELETSSWSVLPVEFGLTQKLLSEAKKRTFHFKVAGITQATDPMPNIRSDRILWLDSKDNLSQTEVSVMESLSFLRESLREYFRVPLNEFECHYSIYEPGQFYARHRDTLNAHNKRIFSFVLYLNPEWSEKDGGHIVGYDGERILFNIQPLAGQLLLFKSEIEHEVLPVHKTRFALTGWMRQ